MDGQAKIATTGNKNFMTDTPAHMPEKAAARAFSKQAPVFDQLYSSDTIIRYKRKRVREHMASFLSVPSTILELNAGTGEDAIYLAQQGHQVHATDISTGMQDLLIKKVEEQQLDRLITYELCSFTELESLQQQGPYDHIFSNFAGLNCTDQLGKVLDSLSYLLKPGGTVTLVVLPKFCLWEFLLLFKGLFKTAFRRFSGRKGTRAHIEGEYFRCWYYNPSYIRKHLKDNFTVMRLEGLCTIVPPSYMENFASKHPGLYRFLEKKENRYKASWPWKVVGDYYIITLRKKH
jgi:ubiquinone/menaquinone biosynthesis C-methylase UbiE